MKCPYCKSENSDTSKTCVKCRRPLSNAKKSSAAPGKAHSHAGISGFGKQDSLKEAIAIMGQIKPTEKDIRPVRKVQELHQEKPNFRKVDAEGPANAELRDSRVKTTIGKGRYKILNQLGAGGMSRVYLAHDTKMDAQVVIKEMQVTESNAGEKEYFQKRFQTEAKLLYRLSCRGIPKVTDFFSEGEANYLVMEYVDGDDLFTVIEKRPDKRITVFEFIDWMWQLLETLEYLHQQDPPIIHRDIKPTNIMINAQGRIILVDFGLATSLMGDNQTQTTIGTFGYASPEHYMGKLTTSSDIFSLGASFHFLLTSEEPARRVPFEYPPVSAYRDDVNEGIDYILGKMLEKNEEDRYGSAREVLDDLKKLADSIDDPAISGSIAQLKMKMRDQSQSRQYLLDSRNISSDLLYSGIRMSGGETPDKTAKKADEATVKSPGPALPPKKKPAENPNADMFLDPKDVFSDDDDEDRDTPSGFLERLSGGIEKSKSVLFKYGTYLLAAILAVLIILLPLKYYANKKSKPADDTKDQEMRARIALKKDLVMGKEYLAQEKNDLAIKSFSRVLESEPKNTEALLGRGRAYASVKDHTRAFDDISSVISIEPENIEAYWIRSNIHLTRGAYKEAQKDLSFLISKVRRNDAGKYFYNRATAYYNLKQNDKAINDLRIYLDIEKDNKKEEGYRMAQKQLSLLLRTSAEEMYKNKLYDQAQPLLQEAMANDPDSAGNHRLLSLIYESRGNTVLAIKEMEQAHRLNSDNDRIRKDLARMLYRRSRQYQTEEKIDKALEDLGAARLLNPDDKKISRELSDIYNKLGVNAFNNRDYAGALKHFDKSLEVQPNVAETLYNRGFTRYTLKDKEGAAKDFILAVKLDPNSDLALRIPADVTIPGRSPAVPEGPDSTQKQKMIFLNEAHNAFVNGNYQKAMENADRAMAADPKGPEAYSLKGEIFLQLKNNEKAVENFEQVIKLAPRGSPIHNSALSRLQALKPPAPEVP